VSVVCVCSRCNILISGKIIKEMPGSVASGKHHIIRSLVEIFLPPLTMHFLSHMVKTFKYYDK